MFFWGAAIIVGLQAFPVTTDMREAPRPLVASVTGEVETAKQSKKRLSVCCGFASKYSDEFTTY